MAQNQFQEYLPPQNIEAEQAVLGSIFRSPDTIVEAMEYVQAPDFYRRSHQLIYQTMLDLNDLNEPIDALSVSNELETKNLLDDVGGRSYLAELTTAVPSSANISYYSKIVKEKSTLRRLIQSSQDIINKSYEEAQPVSDILDEAELAIMKVAEDRNLSDFVHISQILKTNMEHIDDLYASNETITGLSSGYPELDKMTSGFHPDELVIVAARPGVGKTAFALNIAQNIGTQTDQTVAIFSLEMGAEQLVNRMLCAEGTINASNLRTGQLTEEEWSDLIVAAGSLSNANIFIDDTPGIRVSEIRARCRRLKQEQGNLGLIVIDYLQLIEGTGRENRQQEVSEISRQLKKLSKELSVPVLALSQLSRSVESRQDKRPILSDLRESGSIEQDADIVAFLYREDYYRSEEGEEDDAPSDVIEVIIEKNRSGARGTVNLLFLKEYNKFANISYVPETAIPPAN